MINEKNNPQNRSAEKKALKAARDRSYRERHRAKIAQYASFWRLTNAATVSKQKKFRRDCLNESYVANKLRIRLCDCTPELLELKRQQLILKRQINQLKQQLTNETE